MTVYGFIDIMEYFRLMRRKVNLLMNRLGRSNKSLFYGTVIFSTTLGAVIVAIISGNFLEIVFGGCIGACFSLSALACGVFND